MNLDSPPRIILWSAPRCTSTVFEHSIGRLYGVKTFHEIYTNAAYFGEQRIFERYTHQAPAPGLKFTDVQSTLNGTFPDHQAVFCKEMAYSITNNLESLPCGYLHSFLIRSPRKAIASMYRLAVSGEVPQWRNFDPREAGFDAMWALYEHVSILMSRPPVIIDSDEMLSRPPEAMHAYCQAVGLVFDKVMLEWGEPKDQERLERWGTAWYQTLLQSNGFTRPSTPPTDNQAPLPAHIETAIEHAEPYYEKLYARRLSF